MTPRRFGLTAAIAGAALCAVLVVVGAGVLPARVATDVDKIAQFAAALAGLTGAVLAARRSGGARRRWLWWFTAATVSLCVGLSSWMWGQLVAGVPLPSSTLAPIGFIMAPVFLTLGVVTVAHGDGLARRDPVVGDGGVRSGRLLLVLDGLIGLGSLGVLAWVSALEPISRYRWHSGADFVTVLAHPGAYLVLLVVLVALSWTRRSIRQWAMLLVGVGAVAQAASGFAFAYEVSRGVDHIPPVADLGVVVGSALFALVPYAPAPAPERPRGAGGVRGGELLHLLVPYLPLLITCLFLSVGVATGATLNPGELYAGVTVVALVVIRQLITLIDNIRLMERLRQSTAQLAHQAFHDPLTGVANRTLFRQRLEEAVADRRTRHGSLALLFVDVDGFKGVNDRFGHAAGDAVLVAVAERLRASVRESDVVARLGGDEFGVLLSGEVGAPEEIGDRVRAVLREPHEVAGSELVVHASIGVVRHTPSEPELGAEELLGRADAAMYMAKRLGRGVVVVHGSTQLSGAAGS